MASRFVLLNRAAIQSPAGGGYGLLQRALGGLSTPGTVTPAAQGIRHYAGPCRPDLNEAVSSIETKVSDVARRLDALEPRMQTKGSPRSFHMLLGAGYGLIGGILLHHAMILSIARDNSSQASDAKNA